jgi:hypothetical protein
MQVQKRITHWASTIPGLAVIAFLGVCVWVHPGVLDTPEKLVSLGLGLVLIFFKGRGENA